jgi:hypothetical protein
MMIAVEPTVQFADRVMIVAHWNNLQIVDQGGMILSEHVRALTENSELLAQRFPRMIATLSILRAEAPISPKPVREELSAMMKRTRNLEKQTAVVLEATGIIASALRTTLRTSMLMSGNRKMKVVANVDEALPFLLSVVHSAHGKPVTRTELEAVVKNARALYQRKLSA